MMPDTILQKLNALLKRGVQMILSGWAHRTASEINELDWQLSVCEGKFMPPKPEGAMLISEAHGAVADELRKRIEKAIGTLSPDLQKQVWHAFKSDRESN